jgi:hypothetical protein
MMFGHPERRLLFFDTGNFFGFQIGPGLARILKLKPSGGERKNYASDGTYRYSQKGYHVKSLSVFRTMSEDIEMFEMRDDAFEASVGLPALGGKRFTIDYKNRLMGISDRPFDKEGLGIETLFQIDTGKSRTTIDEGLIARAGLKENNTFFRKGYKVDRVTLGKRSFSVDCAKVSNFNAISRGYPRPILIGIGADILSRIVLTVDYSQKKVFVS